jgi:hypothetical protein
MKQTNQLCVFICIITTVPYRVTNFFLIFYMLNIIGTVIVATGAASFTKNDVVRCGSGSAN